VQAKAEVGAEHVITLHDIPLEESGAVPISVVNYTAPTQPPVVLDGECDKDL